ncbi:polysaccharide deacetylase family protein [Maricurvus nonylphenolicus]|uniref:polysaccharide deacetylase family protein n=1 Tax=Maricurvus nonylphenolicus TaxID=1008307 RepID=UPI0036F3491F
MAVLLLGLLPGILISGSLSAAVILQYHHIRDTGPAATRTSPELFRQHLEYLAKHNYQVVELERLINALKQKQPLPDKTVAITFDDGYDSIYHKALPELKRRGWPFTVFINTQPIDERWQGFMSWDQLRELTESGVSIANHSERHWHMQRRQEGENRESWLQRLQAGIETAEERIDDELGQNYRWLAYPYGEYNREIQDLLQQMGYVGLAQVSGPLAPWSDLTALPRFAFGGTYGDINDFAIKVATQPFSLRRAWVTTESGQRLSDPLLPLTESRPILHLWLDNARIAAQVNCFASGQGSIPVLRDGHQLQVQAPESLSVGRSRYNCTAATGEKGRFFWVSQPFWRRLEDGRWYSE